MYSHINKLLKNKSIDNFLLILLKQASSQSAGIINSLQQASQGHATDVSWTGVQEPDMENRFVIRSIICTAKKENFSITLVGSIS